MSIDRFSKLVADQPDNEMFRFSLAQALLKEGRTIESLPHLQRCAEKRSDWMIPRILLGKALLQLDRKSEARPWLELALALAIEQCHEDPEKELRTLLQEF